MLAVFELYILSINSVYNFGVTYLPYSIQEAVSAESLPPCAWQF